MISRQGNLAIIDVDLTDHNLELLRGIPSQGSFRGSNYAFVVCPESIDYVRQNWPGLVGLSEFNNVRRDHTDSPSLAPWAISWEPYQHQKEGFKRSWNKAYYAWLMDMGTGKTALSILNASWLMYKGHVDSMLIVAPSGVHTKWIHDEIPKLWPECVPIKAAAWACNMRKAQRASVDAVFEATEFPVLAMNLEAFSSSAKAYKTAERFLKRNKNCFMVVDESHLIGNPASKRTRKLIKLGKMAKFRRILTGTAGQPLHRYSQYNFLHPDILNIRTFNAFKAEFAVMIELPKKDGRGNPIKIVAVDQQGRKKYKNLDRLKKITEPFTFRVQKSECLDLPEKIYKTIPVELSKEQRSLYNELAEELIVEFEGNSISAILAIQRLTRFRQIVGGFLPDDTGEAKPIGATNPRIERLIEVVDTIDEKIIIWASYVAEIQAIEMRLCEEYGASAVVTYYGENTTDEKEKAKSAFQSGGARFFVSNPQCGGVGLDLYAACYQGFFTNSYNLRDRLQSEDRIHRIGQTRPCTYFDFFAEGTIERQIINSLVQKREIEAELNGDKIIEWLKG